MRKLSLWLLILASSAMLLQCSLISPKPSEECDALRDTGRNNRRAIVFVHGFTGTCEETWDKFPNLLHTDEELSSFDVYSWSYPSGVLGKQPTVRRVGQQLKTYLANVLSKYDEIYLISHSLGGLVVQYMIIDELQNGHASELTRIKHVVFFGSPLQGHDLNSLIRLVKPEYADIDFRSEPITALHTEWIERVYKPDIRTGDRNFKLKIPFTPVCGLEDEFITYNECAAIYGRLAETVPGNHKEMKNPKNREAVSYLVVKGRLLPSAASAMSQRPTQDGRTGIWVARMRGDDDQFSAQRELVQKLLFYLEKESALKNIVEVRELTQEVIGTTESERETLARQLGQRVNASMVIWGEIAALLKKEEFFPRITIGGTVKGIDSTIRLEPVTEISRIQEYQIVQAPQPYTLRTAPERVREPIRLARYVLAIQYYERREWSQAAEHFEALLQGGVPQSIHDRDVHVFAGYSNFHLHFAKDPKDFMLKARTHFQSAKQSYDTSERKDSGYPFVLNMLGLTHLALNAAGRDTTSFVPKPDTLFTEASDLWKERGDKGGYWSAQANLGTTYRLMAKRGIETQQNNQRAINILEKLLNELKEDGTHDSVTEVNLGSLYMEKSDEGQDPTSTKDLLQQAVVHFLNATDHKDDRSPWGTYLAGERGLAKAYDRLMRLGIDEKVNRSKCIASWKEVATIYQENKFFEEYADVQSMIAQIYTDAALKGIDFSENMTKAISALKEASATYRELHKWAQYAGTRNNLAASYEDLFRHNIDGPANLREMKRTLESGIDVFQKNGLKDEEKRFKEMLELINKKDGLEGRKK